jgi:hypothetical protein
MMHEPACRFFNLKKLIIFALIFNSMSAISQPLKSFSTDPVQFFKEFDSFITSADKQQGKEIVDKFEKIWQTKFNSSTQQTVIATSNAMLKKRMTAIPNFRDYFQCLIAYSESNKPLDLYNDWNQQVNLLITKITAGKFDQYLNTSETLFRYNALYKSEAVAWYIGKAEIKFGIDSLPNITISNTDLRGVTRNDSTIIYNTSGVFYPTKFQFEGKGGKLLWERAGLKEAEANATLKNYQLTVKTTKFSSDSAVFIFPKYFKEPLIGQVNEKLTDNPTSRETTYPRFRSYNSEFSIPGIFKNIDYIGGLTVQGAQLLGSGNETNPATFNFKREGKPFIQVQSSAFLIEKNSLQSSQAAVKIRLEEDSIIHPGLIFRYLDDKKQFYLLRNNEGTSKTTFSNTYHQLDMDFEVLEWKIDEPTLLFKAIPGSVESKALFESSDYFREERYIELQGMDEESPLAVLKNLSVANGNREEFHSDEVARFYRIEPTQIRHILRRLSVRGFVQYNEETQMVTFKPRLRKYLLAINGKADYDVIQFKSYVGGSDNNAELSLLNYDLRMNGVERIFLSDSQNVVIYPRNQELMIHKNRDFDFAGRIMAGRFEFFGKKFSFEYDKFKLNLENVDSLRLRVEGSDMNEYGKKSLIKVKTVIENVIGDLLIDHPYNKSGVKSLAQYPIFNSVKNSYAYYQKGSILNNVYNRSNFYFQLDPYIVDSLDNFSNEGLIFKGNFSSAGIFPDLREELRLQEDFSLGFKRTTEEEGLPIYQSKGTFISKIQMSHKGLRGDGEIKYLTTSAKSNDFVFYPDSVNALCRSLTVKATQQGNVEFPDVEAADVKLHWEPYQPNKFEVAQTSQAIVMYAGESKLNGKISIGESGMTGAGMLEFASAEIASKKFKFKKDDFKSDTASFAFTARDEVKNDGTKEVAIKTDNVKADVSFKNRQGQFKSNSEDSYIEFPVNKYIAYMDELRWYMDKDEVDMNSSMNEIDLIGSRFVSIRPDQDSITFVAPKAKYAMADRTIRTDGVKLIRVADATIYPAEEKINVERNAVMTTLKNSRLNANNDLKYHDIYDATIDITAKRKYTASGSYDFEDELGKIQKIVFTKISQDSAGNTIGSGDIDETLNFTFSPNFEFKGKVNLFAPDKSLTFDGGVRIVHNCSTLNKNWLKFKAPIDPTDIQIPVDSIPRSLDNEKLMAGLVLVKDSTHVYPVFMSKKEKTGDQEIINSRGYLKFNKASQEYQLTSKAKFADPELADDYVAMKQANCDVSGEGNLNFGLDIGQVKLQTYGKASHSIASDETKFKAIIAVDFFFAAELWKMIEEGIAASTSLQASDIASSDFKKSLTGLIGKESSDRVLKELASTGTIKRFPDELNKSIVFSNVELKWNTETRSYISEGWLSVSNIGKTPINKVIKGKIELVKKRGGDILNFYLELESQKWYFFNYTRNIMSVIAAEETFNKVVRELDAKKRSVDGENGKPPYQFMIGIEKRKRDFMER